MPFHHFTQIDKYLLLIISKNKGAKKLIDLFDYLETPSRKKAKIY